MDSWPQPEPPPRWTGRQPPFVGRRRELEVLDGLWPEVLRGSRQVLLVGGDPGAGKSRLAAGAALALHRNGVSVLVGACRSDAGLPFDPLVDPVRHWRPWWLGRHRRLRRLRPRVRPRRPAGTGRSAP